MKRLMLSMFILGATVPAIAKNGWTETYSAEDKEYNRLMEVCYQKFHNYSPNYDSSKEIFNYLKGIGTPASLRALKECVRRGWVYSYYLDMV